MSAADFDAAQQALIVQLDAVRALRPTTPRSRVATGAALQAIHEALDRLGDARAEEQRVELTRIVFAECGALLETRERCTRFAGHPGDHGVWDTTAIMPDGSGRSERLRVVALAR